MRIRLGIYKIEAGFGIHGAIHRMNGTVDLIKKATEMDLEKTIKFPYELLEAVSE